MKNVKKTILFTVLILVILNIFCITRYEVFAAKTLQQMEEEASSWLTKGQSEAPDMGDVTQQFLEIGRILTMIGTGVLVIVTTYMGIKYMMASPEGQAKLKQQLIGLVVSSIVVFGAWGIWSLAISIGRTVMGE